eukprot:830202-Prorocentrum_minimum.AAC.1
MNKAVGLLTINLDVGRLTGNPRAGVENFKIQPQFAEKHQVQHVFHVVPQLAVGFGDDVKYMLNLVLLGELWLNFELFDSSSRVPSEPSHV